MSLYPWAPRKPASVLAAAPSRVPAAAGEPQPGLAPDGAGPPCARAFDDARRSAPAASPWWRPRRGGDPAPPAGRGPDPERPAGEPSGAPRGTEAPAAEPGELAEPAPLPEPAQAESARVHRTHPPMPGTTPWPGLRGAPAAPFRGAVVPSGAAALAVPAAAPAAAPVPVGPAGAVWPAPSPRSETLPGPLWVAVAVGFPGSAPEGAPVPAPPSEAALAPFASGPARRGWPWATAMDAAGAGAATAEGGPALPPAPRGWPRSADQPARPGPGRPVAPAPGAAAEADPGAGGAIEEVRVPSRQGGPGAAEDDHAPRRWPRPAAGGELGTPVPGAEPGASLAVFPGRPDSAEALPSPAVMPAMAPCLFGLLHSRVTICTGRRRHRGVLVGVSPGLVELVEADLRFAWIPLPSIVWIARMARDGGEDALSTASA